MSDDLTNLGDLTGWTNVGWLANTYAVPPRTELRSIGGGLTSGSMRSTLALARRSSISLASTFSLPSPFIAWIT